MKTVLIVDDSTLMRKMIRKILAKNGYDVVGEAKNGKVGVEKYKELRPDIVTMDLVMNDMNGLEALKHIIGEYPEANVLMISSIGQEVVVRDAIILGAKNFILKPFDENQVMNAIRKM